MIDLLCDYLVTYVTTDHAVQRPIRHREHDSPEDDAVWSAMNDASRRKMLDLLRESALTTHALCAHFSFSRFAVMKHLTVLEQANLVIVERRGRERYNHLNPAPLQAIYRRWIRPFEQLPADRLLRIKQLAETDN
ncbi:MAG: metalloregulator ArsR/SmtB family transcription factor [Pseudomonadota bacterium]